MTYSHDWGGWQATGREWTARNGRKFRQWRYSGGKVTEFCYRLDGTDDCYVEPRWPSGWRAVVNSDAIPTKFREMHTAAEYVAKADALQEAETRRTE